MLDKFEDLAAAVGEYAGTASAAYNIYCDSLIESIV